MNVEEKLKILSDAAKYDVSCSSSGSTRQNMPGGIGNAAQAGICHSWADDGRCISLLKILFTNYCIYNCAYCINRSSNDVPRAAFTVDEVVELTVHFYQRNYIEGLFLSSGVIKNADYTMECLMNIIKKLRIHHKFNGYIHVKAIPGASEELIRKAGLYADRMSANIELPSERALLELAPDKKKTDIFDSMNCIGSGITENKAERKQFRKTPKFVPAGQSTQLIVGASNESDHHILNLCSHLYKKYEMKRVYYSAFIPVSEDNRLPVIAKPPLLREHRLYQADWLMRFYKFDVSEIISEKHPFLDENLDPKACWALRNLDFFPVEINTADYRTLLRIPGLGVKSALKIVKARKFSSLDFNDLKKIGVVLKRARFFITCRGKTFEPLKFNETTLKVKLLANTPASQSQQYEQLTFNWA